MSEVELTELKRLLKMFSDYHLIRPSSSSWGAPVLFSKKKDGLFRFCIDYRRLNTMVERDATTSPLVNEVLSDLARAQLFSTLDLHSGYYQIAMHQDSIHLTAFKTRYGNFEWLVLPMGLSNAPATFIRMINAYFFDYLREFLQIYVDDLLVYSEDFDHHLEHLKKVFEVLRTHKLYVKPRKCTFASSSVEYLGHVVSSKGISPSSDKIKCISEWPRPSTINECE
jgi:hypothetical protein